MERQCVNNWLKELQMIEIEILEEIKRICEKNELQYFIVAGTLLGAVRHKGFIPWDDDMDIAMPREDYIRFEKICKTELDSGYFLQSYRTDAGFSASLIKIRKNNTIYKRFDEKDFKYKHYGVWVDIFPLDNSDSLRSKRQQIKNSLVVLLDGAINVKSKASGDVRTMKRRLFSMVSPFISKNVLIILREFIASYKKEGDSFVNYTSQYGWRRQTFEKSIYFPGRIFEINGHYFNGPSNAEKMLKTLYGDYMMLPPIEKRNVHNPIEIKL